MEQWENSEKEWFVQMSCDRSQHRGRVKAGKAPRTSSRHTESPEGREPLGFEEHRKGLLVYVSRNEYIVKDVNPRADRTKVLLKMQLPGCHSTFQEPKVSFCC